YQRTPRAHDMSHTHDLEAEPGDTGGDDPRQGRDAELAGVAGFHDHQGGGAVGQRAAVAGGHGSLGPEHGVEGGDLLEGGAGPRGGVGADHGAGGGGDRGDVAVEEAGGDGGFGALLGADSVLILGLAGEAAQLGDVLRVLVPQDVGVGQ